MLALCCERAPPTSELVRAHLLGDILGLADRERDDGKRRVAGVVGGELAAIGHEQVVDIVALAPFIDDALGRVIALMRQVPRL